MAVSIASELQAVQDVTSSLREALVRVRALKSTDGVDPPLPTGELSTIVDDLDTSSLDLGHRDLQYRFAAFESASRDTFYALIDEAAIDEPAFVEVWNLLDILLLCGDRGKCAPELVCWLIEELLDSQTTEGCRTVFDYLESRRERLAAKDFHKKNLVFLRSCNELLRRLSKAEDAVFCGRVFFFLFQTFPLGDKSSVNLRGEFHVENTTKYDASLDDSAIGDDAMEVDSTSATNTSMTPSARHSKRQPAVKAGSKGSPTKNVQAAVEEDVLDSTKLYPIFWRLQQDFSDPTRLFETDQFEKFKKGLAATLSKFKKTPTVQAKSSNEEQRGVKRKHATNKPATDGDDHFVDNYNPKYLTSRDLFDLELSDLAFQRHILVQALILIDFLLSLTEKAKQKIAALPVQKSMLYNFTLNEADSKWAVSTKATIKQSLQSTSDGRFYDRMVETVLARDKNWVRWKVESCPSIVRDAVTTAHELEARQAAADYVRPRKVPPKPMGAINLDFLTDGQGGGLESLKDPSRYNAPGVEDLLKGIDGDTLDLEMALDDEETERYKNMIANKTWRVLREARSSRLGLLGGLEPGKSLGEVLRPQEVAEEHDGEGEGAAQASETADDVQESLPTVVVSEEAMVEEVPTVAA